jgi:hypothetical protein
MGHTSIDLPGKIKEAKSRTTRQVLYITYHIDKNLTVLCSLFLEI